MRVRPLSPKEKRLKMPESCGDASAAACFVVTTSGRSLVQWEQDATLPLQPTQLSLLLASLFHFSRAQRFGRLELRNGLTLLVSSDAAAQICVAVVCATPASAAATGYEPMQLARLQSLLVLREFVRCYGDAIERRTEETRALAERKAEEYTLSSALDGVLDGGDGTLDEFVAFQSGFVAPVMEATARNVSEAIRSWSPSRSASSGADAAALRLVRGFLMNAETGDMVFSTAPGENSGFFGSGSAAQRLEQLHGSVRVQQLLKRVAGAVVESSGVLRAVVEADADASVVVRVNHMSGGHWSEVFTGVFVSGVVFHGLNPLFQGRESGLLSSGQLHRALAADPSGGRMLSVLRDASIDLDLHVGSDGAPLVVWQATKALTRPLKLSWSASDPADWTLQNSTQNAQ
ncbi:hypothetical protein BBJ28_00013183 [Nothophytophthora sp. Chile5]|nr:hypothetical protein BBJ28_00013183 [Nothophytophthora sp. Chile5]